LQKYIEVLYRESIGSKPEVKNMANGYVGKILRINLTTKTISTIDTARFEEFGGGFGISAAIFWDLAVVP
jgi:hypothetical protein